MTEQDTEGSDQSTDEVARSPRLRELVRKGIDEDGYIKTGILLGSLASIAFFLLVPEYLRMAACWLVGKDYKPPTHRMVEDIDGLEPRD
jgi:hypothetical protein